MERIKIVSFNIHKGLNTTQSKFILPGLKTLLEKLDPDVIFLQEVQGEHHKRKQKFAEWPTCSQTEYLAHDRWKYYCYGKNHSHQHGHHGNAILSKFPLYAVENHDITASRFSDRGLLYARVDHFNKPLHLLCTHFGLLKKERTTQADALYEYINNIVKSDESLLLAGDFNDWQMSSLQQLKNSLSLKEVFDEIKGDYAKSFPAEMPLLKVDRIYFKGLDALTCDVVNIKGLSDHLPLSAEFITAAK